MFSFAKKMPLSLLFSNKIFSFAANLQQNTIFITNNLSDEKMLTFNERYAH